MEEAGTVQTLEPVIDSEVQNAVQDEGQEASQEVDKEVVPEKPKEEPIPKGVQRRIDRAVKRQYEAEAKANELERRLQMLEQQSQPRSKAEAPKYEDFNDFDAYSRAIARHEAKQEIEATLTAHQRAEAERQAQAAREVTAETWAKRAAAAKAEMPDFEEVVSSSSTQFKDPVILDAIRESDIGPKIAYYLASNADEAEEIADMSTAAAIRAIGRIEAKLEDGKVSVTRTPAPIKPVGQKTQASKAPTEMSPAEFAKWRKSFIAQRGSR